MVYVMLLAMVLGTALVLALWPESSTEPGTGAAPSPRTKASAKASPGPPPESLEGVLVAQLTSGEINRRQYLREMEKLAARDDERHPLAVPPDLGPAAA